MKHPISALIAVLLISPAGCAKVTEPSACGPVPNENQLEVMGMETGAVPVTAHGLNNIS